MLSAFDRDAERQRLLTRRMLVLGGLKAGAVSALLARLYYLQIVESDKYATMADDNRISLRLLAPPRGLIVDRHGVPLAVNEQNFRLVLVSEQAGNPQEVLDKVAQLIPVSETEHRRILRDLQRSRRFAPVTLKENLTWDQVSAIEVNLPDLPGSSIDVGQVRSYPFGEATAHVLGYVGAVSEKELVGSEDPLLSLPGFRIGKNGVERHHDLALRGTSGTQQLEVNAVGRVVRELSREPGQPGRQVTLTLDAKLQHYVQQRLSAERSAAAVVMDVQTGGILALNSSPSFDPNQFATGISQDLWSRLTSDETGPLTNKAVAGQYPPGSTFKMIVGLAALEAGIATPDTRVFCPGHLELGGHRFHCWKKGGHGGVNMSDAIKHSCNVYYFEMARRLGIDRLSEMARRFGLGGRTELDLPGERPGMIPNSAWKKATFKDVWHPGETLVAAIGQGYVLATPIQLAVMTARMVNGGYAVKPHLTSEVEGLYEAPTAWPEVGVKPEHLKVMINAMNRVVTEPGGTAYSARIMQAGMEMGGKTGSSLVRRITMAERATGVKKNEDLPWKERDHGLFVGYAPVHAPRFACSVVVEHGGGGKFAAPIARDILLECQMLDAARLSAQQAERPPERAADSGTPARGTSL
ncbi:penicillin-binding protein 2 [Indioceanicola profundi]|uniref:penicillin-binding protein 2 n=1 Tax=Indioceanicola profundi TaxID=2220096 RepID=UPI000E6A9706|nr:penicillin-binding protein 2 [Indioceanicola profundi]